MFDFFRQESHYGHFFASYRLLCVINLFLLFLWYEVKWNRYMEREKADDQAIVVWFPTGTGSFSPQKYPHCLWAHLTFPPVCTGGYFLAGQTVGRDDYYLCVGPGLRTCGSVPRFPILYAVVPD
jgi:hypothetical protein